MKESARRRKTLPSDYVSLDVMIFFSIFLCSLLFSVFILHCLSFFPLFVSPPVWLPLHHRIFANICVAVYFLILLYFPNFTLLSIFFSFFFHFSLYFCSLALCQLFIHLLCVKGYRVHSSGSLMPVTSLWGALAQADVFSLQWRCCHVWLYV